VLICKILHYTVLPLEQIHKLQKFTVELYIDMSNVVTATAKQQKSVLLKIVTTTTTTLK